VVGLSECLRKRDHGVGTGGSLGALLQRDSEFLGEDFDHVLNADFVAAVDESVVGLVHGVEARFAGDNEQFAGVLGS
jgi:hypothetical protein